MGDLRTWKDGATAYYVKDAVRHIREQCEPFKNPVYVYIALCEIASNRGSEEFTAGLSEIGNLCAIHGRKTLGPVIEQLEELRLIQVERSKLRAPSRFRLLRFKRDEQP